MIYSPKTPTSYTTISHLDLLSDLSLYMALPTTLAPPSSAKKST